LHYAKEHDFGLANSLQSATVYLPVGARLNAYVSNHRQIDHLVDRERVVIHELPDDNSIEEWYALQRQMKSQPPSEQKTTFMDNLARWWTELHGRAPVPGIDRLRDQHVPLTLVGSSLQSA
jgi:hypothetical protein